MAEENLGRAVLALTTDDKGLDKGLDAAERKTEGWAGRVGGVLKGGLLVGAGVVAAAGIGLVKVLSDSADEAMNAQRATALLNSTLTATGGVSGKTAQGIEAMSLSLSEVIPIEDDVITGAQSMLLTFKNVTGETFDRATLAILDMATAMNQGGIPSSEQLQSTSIQLGKALNDPIAGMGALGRVGVQFSEEQKAAIKAMVETNDLAGAQALILKEVESQFGGAAKAAGGTFAGQMTILNNVLGNVKEEIGGALLPVLSQLATEYGPMLIQFAKDAGKWIAETLIPAIVTLVEWLKIHLPPVIQFLSDLWQTVLLPALTVIYEFIRDKMIPSIEEFVEWLQVYIPKAVAWANQAWQTIQPALAIVKQAVDNVSRGLREAIDWLHNVSNTVSNLRIPNPFAELLRNIQDVIDAVRTALDWLGKLPGRIGGYGGAQGLGGMGAQSMGALGGLALAPAAENRSYQNTANNITINAPGGDPQKIRTAVIDGLATARARGLR